MPCLFGQQESFLQLSSISHLTIFLARIIIIFFTPTFFFKLEKTVLSSYWFHAYKQCLLHVSSVFPHHRFPAYLVFCCCTGKEIWILSIFPLTWAVKIRTTSQNKKTALHLLMYWLTERVNSKGAGFASYTQLNVSENWKRVWSASAVPHRTAKIWRVVADEIKLASACWK